MVRRGFTLIELVVVIPLVPHRKPARRGFTLIELLVVIAIVAVLAVVVVLVLNPAQLLQQARDSNRMSDLASINAALGYYLADSSLAGTVSLGTVSTTYLSVPDATATTTAGDHCDGLGLASLPAGWGYHCGASSTYRKSDTTGWLPVNFANMTNGSPLGQLPIDANNTTSTGLYYSYAENGSQYQLTGRMESAKYIPNEVASGGSDPALYTIGSNRSIAPFVGGMVGWWPLNEGSGNTAFDNSGYGDNGAWNGADTHWGTSFTGGVAGLFTASSDYVSVPSQSQLNTGAQVTVTAWVKITDTAQNSIIAGKSIWWDSHDYELNKDQDTGGNFNVNGSNHTGWTGGSLGNNTWNFLAGTYDGTNMNYYVNGVLKGSTKNAGITLTNADPFVMGGNVSGSMFAGAMNNVRVYNRALSAAEIAAIYSAQK